MAWTGVLHRLYAMKAMGPTSDLLKGISLSKCILANTRCLQNSYWMKFSQACPELARVLSFKQFALLLVSMSLMYMLTYGKRKTLSFFGECLKLQGTMPVCSLILVLPFLCDLAFQCRLYRRNAFSSPLLLKASSKWFWVSKYDQEAEHNSILLIQRNQNTWKARACQLILRTDIEIFEPNFLHNFSNSGLLLTVLKDLISMLMKKNTMLQEPFSNESHSFFSPL